MMAYDLGGNWQKELQRLELSQYLSTKQVWEVLPPYEPGEPVSNMDFSKLYRELKVFHPSPGPAEAKPQNLPSTELGGLDHQWDQMGG